MGPLKPAVLVLVVAACGSAPARIAAPATSPKPTNAPDDRSLFPVSAPALLDAEREPEPAAKEKLARRVLTSLDEERQLSAESGPAFARLQTRARIALGMSLATQGRKIELLAELAQQPIDCPATPKHVHATCSDLMAAVATALPNAVDTKGRVVQVDAALVLDAMTAPDAMTAFAKKVATQVGTVVQRARVTKTKTALEIVGASKVRFLVSPTEVKRLTLGDGEIVWFAFDARSLKKTGQGWDIATAHVLRIEHASSSSL